MSKRVRFELLPGETGWDVTRDSVVIANFAVKSIGEQYAVERAQAVQRQHGLAQLVIKGRDGQIKDERTYGKDPADIVG